MRRGVLLLLCGLTARQSATARHSAFVVKLPFQQQQQQQQHNQHEQQQQQYIQQQQQQQEEAHVMQQRGRTALFAKRKEGDPQVNNRMRDLQVITNIENEAQLLDLASTSSFARAGSPKGVVMVVLYMSLMGDTDALAELTELAEAFPDCNFARVCKEFSKGPELIRARMVEDLPSWEVIAEGKRLSLTAGAGGAGRAEALRRLAEYGFSAARPLSRVVTFDLASPLGWRRDTASLEVTFLKPGGQAEATGQGEWVVGSG